MQVMKAFKEPFELVESKCMKMRGIFKRINGLTVRVPQFLPLFTMIFGAFSTLELSKFLSTIDIDLVLF